MKLIHKATGQEVKLGDEVTNFRGETAIVEGIQKPRHSGSTGMVYVKFDPSHNATSGYYPSVFELEWVEREDQEPGKSVIVGGKRLEFDKAKLLRLKAARDAAILYERLHFEFDGALLRVDHARVIIQYLEDRLK